MRKNFVIALIIFSLAIMFVAGCSNRGEKTPTASDSGSGWGGWSDVDAAFKTSSWTASAPPQLLFQLRNPDAIMKIDVFIPKEAWPVPRGGGQRVPLLILLAPENEDENFYRNRGLYELATQMIADGDIQPMMVATVGNDPTFGGYFYGNSYAGGQYDAIIADTILYYDSFVGKNIARGLLAYIDNNNLGDYLLNSPSKRGIGGVGQGAYGAFRAILKHPDVFTSISVTDGPLSFADGLPALFDATIVEQLTLDPTFDDMTKFDTSFTTPLSRMFVGGAIAFSPLDTFITYTIYPTNIFRPDTVVINSREQWTESTSSLVTDLIVPVWGDWDFHMPFDVNGTKNDAVWSRWMDNDLSTLWAAEATALDNVSIWIGTSSQAKWNYDEMTEAWISALGNNVDEVYRYQGYSGNPATDNEYVYDLLKRMLKFHSDNFGTN